jgi:ferredoxin-thioredoxin reductase catalytic subunit
LSFGIFGYSYRVFLINIFLSNDFSSRGSCFQLYRKCGHGTCPCRLAYHLENAKKVFVCHGRWKGLEIMMGTRASDVNCVFLTSSVSCLSS